jgi:hypothetical protein
MCHDCMDVALGHHLRAACCRDGRVTERDGRCGGTRRNKLRRILIRFAHFKRCAADECSDIWRDASLDKWAELCVLRLYCHDQCTRKCVCYDLVDYRDLCGMLPARLTRCWRQAATGCDYRTVAGHAANGLHIRCTGRVSHSIFERTDFGIRACHCLGTRFRHSKLNADGSHTHVSLQVLELDFPNQLAMQIGVIRFGAIASAECSGVRGGWHIDAAPLYVRCARR